MLLKEAENVSDFLTEIVKFLKKTVFIFAYKICLGKRLLPWQYMINEKLVFKDQSRKFDEPP